MKSSPSEIERCLRTAGWFPGRRIDTTIYEQFYLTKGYPIYPVVMEFLSEYGGLKFKFKFESVIRNTHIVDDFVFDPTTAMIGDAGAKYSADVGRRLVVIGTHYLSYVDILMDEEGLLYLGVHDEASPYASSMEEMVDTFVYQYINGDRQAIQLPGS